MAKNEGLLAAAYLNVDSILYLMRRLKIQKMPLVLALYDNVFNSHQQDLVDEVTYPRLTDAQLIDADGAVDPALASWLRILESPDITASLQARNGQRVRRVVVARRGADHVMAARAGDEVVVQVVWSQDRSVDEVVAAPLWDALRLSKTNMDPPPAEMKSVTWEYTLGGRGNMPDAKPGIPAEIERIMGSPGPTARVLQELTTARGQRCEITMEQTWDMKPTYCPAGVLVADTRYGRVISGTRRERSRMVNTIGGGTYSRFVTAIRDLSAMAPSGDWFAKPSAPNGFPGPGLVDQISRRF